MTIGFRKGQIMIFIRAHKKNSFKTNFSIKYRASYVTRQKQKKKKCNVMLTFLKEEVKDKYNVKKTLFNPESFQNQ